MKKLVLCLLACVCMLSLSAQSSSLHKFKSYNGRDYFQFGVGPNYMFSDVGGANFRNLWFTDWDVLYTRPSIMWGYKHEYNEFIANKLSFTYSMFSGSDDNSRNNRQFQYYANAIEASLQTEIMFFKGSYKRHDFDLYGYFGIAGMYYQTNMKYVYATGALAGQSVTENGVPISHRTYSDVVPDGLEYNASSGYFQYSAPTLAVPFGIGIRFPINYKVYLGAEFGYTYPIGANADFIDGFYTKWSSMNDAFCNFSVVLSYKIAGGDNCYSKYGRKQIGKGRR